MIPAIDHRATIRHTQFVSRGTERGLLTSPHCAVATFVIWLQLGHTASEALGDGVESLHHMSDALLVPPNLLNELLGRPDL